MRRSRLRARPADNHLSAAEWQAAFHLLLTRSGGLCEARTPACLAAGGQLAALPREKVSVQHRRAQGLGGTALAETHNLANLLVICGTGTSGCHGWIECDERGQAEARGLWVRHSYRDDGDPVPVQEYPLTLWSGRRVLLHPSAPLYLPHPDEWGVTELTKTARDAPYP